VSGYRSLPSDGIRAPAQGKPECLLTWIVLPTGGIRLYASRQLHDPGWGQRTTDGGEVQWHLDVNITEMLIVDRPTIGDAVGFVLNRWREEDHQRENAEIRRGLAQSAIPALPEGHSER
jgi:hypothetical protein